MGFNNNSDYFSLMILCIHKHHSLSLLGKQSTNVEMDRDLAVLSICYDGECIDLVNALLLLQPPPDDTRKSQKMLTIDM